MMSTKREGARLTISRPILRLVADGFWGEREGGGGSPDPCRRPYVQ